MGKFTGLNDQEWAVVEPLIPYRWGITQSGTQPLHPRKILNTLIWILTTGARWCDVPVDLPSPSTCWRRLQEWAGEGCLELIQAAVLEELDDLGVLDWDQLVADATFIRGKKGGTRSATPSAARA